MTKMPIYLHFLYAFIASTGFSVFLCSPKKTLIASGFCGAIGWTSYYYLSSLLVNNISSNFIATLLVALISEILARKLKQPAIIFIIPGIIPLVPGLGMYNTMLYLVQSNFDEAISKGADVLFVGGAIALGVLIITSLSKTLNLIIGKNSNSE